MKKVFGSRERYLGSKAPSPTCQVPQKTVVSEVFRNVKENLFFLFSGKPLTNVLKCALDCGSVLKGIEMNLKEALDKNQKEIDEVIHKSDSESVQKFRALVRERIRMLLEND